jgi:hypothetical protein
VSVYMIIFDEAPPVIWNVGIGFWWLVGGLLQLAAGSAARLGQFTGATSEAKAPRRTHNRAVNRLRGCNSFCQLLPVRLSRFWGA